MVIHLAHTVKADNGSDLQAVSFSSNQQAQAIKSNCTTYTTYVNIINAHVAILYIAIVLITASAVIL